MVTQCKVATMTAIKVSFKNKDRLAKLGAKDETYDHIVERLLDYYETMRLKKI